MREASESAPRGEKARHGETKASGAVTRRESDAAAITFCTCCTRVTAPNKREKRVLVCVLEDSQLLHRRNHVLSAASLQPHREREENRTRDLFDGLPVEAPCVRKREKKSGRQFVVRGGLSSSLLASAGQPQSKSQLIILCSARVRIAAYDILYYSLRVVSASARELTSRRVYTGGESAGPFVKSRPTRD